MIKKFSSLFNIGLLPQVLIKNRGLLWQFSRRIVEAKYRGSLLGLIWTFVQPLMMLIVYTFVFSVVFKAKWGVGIEDEGKGMFAVVMFCGMSLYNLFAESVNTSCMCVTSNANLVKKVIFPLEILPAAQVLASFLLGMVWFVLLFFGSWLVMGFVGWTMLLFPVVLFPLMIFSLGISYFVAALGVFVKDTFYAVGVVLQILFFATPIFYPIAAVPEKFRWILEWNPLTVYIEQMRNVFLYGKMPDWQFLGIAVLLSLMVMQLGFFFFMRTKRGFSDVL
jgi:lipopolysaccharide transport system permease protein